jgi:thiol-disulfide isomerase/thioredoxin
VIDRIKRSTRRGMVEHVLGGVLLATAVVMATNLDVRFEEALAKDTSLPAILVNPTRALETTHAVRSRLASLHPGPKFADASASASASASTTGSHASNLPKLGAAPDFTGTQRWFNTPGGQPLSLKQLRGRVVLVDFWTYTCINCIRTLPFLKGLYATYHRSGLEIVGVETPEFTFEQDAGNVAQATRSDGLRYPVVQDNRFGTWNAYGNQSWPAEYLIDAGGQVRHTQFGEGDYDKSEAAVRSLLTEAGATHLPRPMTAKAMMPSAGLNTPETYLDDKRAQGFIPRLQPGIHDYDGPSRPDTNEFSLLGRWNVSSESSTPAAPGASIQAGFQAAHVYLVLTSAGNVPRQVHVLLDGHPVPPTTAGQDVHAGAVTVRGQRLYELVSLPHDEQHALSVQVPPGVSAYDFTFG